MTPDQFTTRMVNTARHLGRPLDGEANGLLVWVVEGCRVEWASSGEKYRHALRMALLRGVLLARTSGEKVVTRMVLAKALNEVHMLPTEIGQGGGVL